MSEPFIAQVSNVSTLATIDQIEKLFEFMGKIRDIKMYPSNTTIVQPPFKVCYIKFAESWSVRVALHLTNTVFIDRALVVVAVPGDSIPSEDATPFDMLNTGSALPGLLGNDFKDMSNDLTAVDGNLMITSTDTNLDILGLPQYPPLSADQDPNTIEEIRRTIFIENIHSSVVPSQLLDFVNGVVGEVKYLRMATREKDSTQSAYIEFTDRASIVKALQCDGITMKGGKLKISHSTTAIIKSQKGIDLVSEKDTEEALKRLKEAESLIAKVVEPEITGKRSRSRRRSSSRSRRRSTSRSRRSSSRSRRRSRSRHRSRDRRRRSRSSPRRKRASRSPRRRRSRSKSKERRRRSRSKDRRRRSRSKERLSESRKKRSRSRSPSSRSNRRHRSRSRSKESVAKKSKRSHSRSRSKSRPKKSRRSRSGSRDKKSRRDRSRSKSKADSKDVKKSKSVSPEPSKPTDDVDVAPADPIASSETKTPESNLDEKIQIPFLNDEEDCGPNIVIKRSEEEPKKPVAKSSRSSRSRSRSRRSSPRKRKSRSRERRRSKSPPSVKDRRRKRRSYSSSHSSSRSPDRRRDRKSTRRSRSPSRKSSRRSSKRRSPTPKKSRPSRRSASRSRSRSPRKSTTKGSSSDKESKKSASPRKSEPTSDI